MAQGSAVWTLHNAVRDRACPLYPSCCSASCWKSSWIPIPDPQVRQAVWQRANPEQLQLALDLAAEIKRPLEDNHVEQLGERYNAAHQFAPRVP